MASVGVDRWTGKPIDGWAHVRQSVADILTTRVLTRVMRREYGADAPDLVDAPMTDKTRLAFFSAIATALVRWEPRFEITNVQFVDVSAQGRVGLRMSGNYFPRGHLGDRDPETPDERAEQRAIELVSNGADFFLAA